MLKTYFLYSGILLAVFVLETIVSGGLQADVLFKFGGIVYSRFYVFRDGRIQLLDMNEVCSAPLWFLTAYVCANGLFHLTRWLADVRGLRFSVVFAVLALLAAALWYSPVLLPWSLDTAPFNALFMWLGKFYRDHENECFKGKVKKSRGILFLCLAVLWAATAVFNGHPNISIGNYGNRGVISIVLFAITGSMGSVLFLELCKKTEHVKVLAPLEKTGRNTLFLLGFHLLVYKYADQYFLHVNMGRAAEHFLDMMVIIGTACLLTVIHEIMNASRQKRLKDGQTGLT